MKRLFSAILVTACAVGLMPHCVSADDDYEDYLEDLREAEEERREDYEDWLEDQREEAEERWEDYQRYWRRRGVNVGPQPKFSPSYGSYYYGAPVPGLKREGTLVYPQPYRAYSVPQAVPQSPHLAPKVEMLPMPGVPTAPPLVPPLNGRPYREF
jgi:hypothetical protein